MAAPLKYPLTLIAWTMLLPMLPSSVSAQAPKPAPAAPAGPAVSIASLNRTLTETDAAFDAKDYTAAVTKIEFLLKAVGTSPLATPEMLEMLHFNIGLAYLLGDRAPEAEDAFTKCLTKFPKGAYASRCYLGVGKACIAQDNGGKKDLAVKALRLAMQDWKYSSEAGLLLGQLFNDMGKRKEALEVFRGLMGADVRTPQQTAAAVGVIDILADNSNTDDLVYYLDRMSNMAGVRDAIAWYSNQVVVCGDTARGNRDYDTALAIYQTVPSRKQILDAQALSLEGMRKTLRTLEATVAAEQKNPDKPRSIATELIGSLKPGIDMAEKAMAAIEEKKELDAFLLMRRGSCFYHLERLEEARVCFSTLRLKYPAFKDTKTAAYAEIMIMDKLKKIEGLLALCNAYQKAYPDSENAEVVGTLAGELLVQENKWKEVGPYYEELAKKFPKSSNMDRFIFYQALSHFLDADFPLSTPLFEKIVHSYPKSGVYETTLYHLAMTYFLGNKEKEAKAACSEYLSKYPGGLYAGDMQYRLSFIDSNDPKVEPDKIIGELTEFMKSHPEDVSKGSMLCLLADTYKKKYENAKTKNIEDEDAAIQAYKDAVWTKSPDDVIQYALDSATTVMSSRKDWDGIAELHGRFLVERPESQLALLSAGQVVKMKKRLGKDAEAAEILASSLKNRISDPSIQQVEYLLDQMVTTMVPRKKSAEIDAEALDKQLEEMLGKIIGDKPNPTATARLFFARARLDQLIHHADRSDRSDLLLNGIATNYANDPAVLSPTLLSVCGNILLKEGNLDGAEAMFKRLTDSYKDSLFADAGPYGLGMVAMARKQPDLAYRIFQDTLTNNKGTSKFKETTLAKLQALIDLEKFDEVRELALQIAGDKMFRGEASAKAYMILAQSYRSEAAKPPPGADAKELLAKAHGYYQRVYVANQSMPEVCAEAYWQAYETAKEMNEYALASDTLKALVKNPKLKNTQRAKDASKISL